MSRLGDRDAHLYESLAGLLAEAMTSGTLRSGDRLPSVRTLCRQYGVSVATVLQAYRVLEDRRLIDARPKSGYFVASRAAPLDEPAPSRPPQAPRYVVTPTLLQEFMAAIARDDVTNLGAALPRPDAFPVARLARLLCTQLRRNPGLTADYRVGKGSHELRQVIARRALEIGVEAEVDDVLITDGCMEALSLCLRAAARPGDVIALESPTYYLFLHAIQSLGMRALEIPTHPRTGLSIEALDLATQRGGKVRAVLIGPSYSNPLGSVMPEQDKMRLVALCAERDVAVIEDDVLGDTCFGAKRPLPAKAWDRTGNVMLCSSFSKTLAPGLRIGWTIPGRRMKDVEVNKRATTIFTPIAAQLALAEFVGSGGYDHHLRRLRADLTDRAWRFTEATGRSFPAQCRVTRPTGGYNFWVELPPAVDAVALFRAAVDAGVVVAPGPLFTTSDRYRNCLRMTCCQPWSHRTEHAIATVGGLARRGGA